MNITMTCEDCKAQVRNPRYEHTIRSVPITGTKWFDSRSTMAGPGLETVLTGERENRGYVTWECPVCLFRNSRSVTNFPKDSDAS